MLVFGFEKPIIGMIHLNALPGTPKFSGDAKSIINKAIEEAKIYLDNYIPILMIENMHDTPYLNRVLGPEIPTLMSIILYEIKQRFNVPLGIQILAGANKEAIAAAYNSNADFIRAEGFVFSHIADEGMFNSDAGELLRYRKSINADNIKIFTDIKKKHSSHSITNDVDITETAKAAEFFLSDGVIITGGSTGKEPKLDEISAVKKSISIPVLAGSGITATNIQQFKPHCDAFIIGSYFKKEGFWQNDLDVVRIKEFYKNYNS